MPENPPLGSPGVCGLLAQDMGRSHVLTPGPVGIRETEPRAHDASSCRHLSIIVTLRGWQADWRLGLSWKKAAGAGTSMSVPCFRA